MVSIVKMYVRDEEISEVEISSGRRYSLEKVGVCMASACRPRPSLSAARAVVIVAGVCFPQLHKNDFLPPTCHVIPLNKHTQRCPISIENAI